MLEVRDLHSFYGDAHVLHGASLTVKPGEVVALLGRNGMGKSTLIRSIMRLLKPAKAREGWTVDRVFAMFPRLAEHKGHNGNQLSGGERQMLAVGRALMIDPELILMDEPSEGLAPVMVQHLETIIADLGRTGLGILLVEQNLYSALAVADRLYVLETGKVVHEASAESVRNDQSPLMRYLGVH